MTKEQNQGQNQKPTNEAPQRPPTTEYVEKSDKKPTSTRNR